MNANPMPTNANPVLRFQLGGLAHHPPEGDHTCLGKWKCRPPPMVALAATATAAAAAAFTIRSCGKNTQQGENGIERSMRLLFSYPAANTISTRTRKKKIKKWRRCAHQNSEGCDYYRIKATRVDQPDSFVLQNLSNSGCEIGGKLAGRYLALVVLNKQQ